MDIAIRHANRLVGLRVWLALYRLGLYYPLATLLEWLSRGHLSLHELGSGLVGLCADTSEGWTSEGVLVP